MINIYTQSTNSRLQYSCNIIFKTILKTEYTFTSNKANLVKGDINYSNEPISGAFQIIPSGLLEQNGIENHNTLPGEYQKLKTLFHSGEGSIPFDIFSAVFYMCSRYEEYLPFESDEHGRFKAADSIAYRYGFINEPIVELWVQLLAKELKIDFNKDTYRSLLTIDVDDAWKYKNRPVVLNLAKLAKSLITLKFKEFSFQFAVLLNKKHDPWFTFKYLSDIEERFKLSIQYFFLIGRKRPYDKAISIKNKHFRALIKSLWQKKKLGIHPSYASNFSEQQLRKEYFALAEVNVNKPLQSRQHYLKLTFPNTFRNIIRLGIIEDYSLGWASTIGFRAGISCPFSFYDLIAEKESHLQLVPFMIMDRTLKDYMNLSPTEALLQIKALIDKIKSIGGQFTMLWHNDSVSNYGEWEGWREVFEEVLDYAKE